MNVSVDVALLLRGALLEVWDADSEDSGETGEVVTVPGDSVELLDPVGMDETEIVSVKVEVEVELIVGPLETTEELTTPEDDETVTVMVV